MKNPVYRMIANKILSQTGQKAVSATIHLDGETLLISGQWKDAAGVSRELQTVQGNKGMLAVIGNKARRLFDRLDAITMDFDIVGGSCVVVLYGAKGDDKVKDTETLSF